MLIPERAKALAGIHRALRTGGRLAAVALATSERDSTRSVLRR
jgi:hypothetical protein